jgi:hypothetical protein
LALFFSERWLSLPAALLRWFLQQLSSEQSFLRRLWSGQLWSGQFSSEQSFSRRLWFEQLSSEQLFSVQAFLAAALLCTGFFVSGAFTLTTFFVADFDFAVIFAAVDFFETGFFTATFDLVTVGFAFSLANFVLSLGLGLGAFLPVRRVAATVFFVALPATTTVCFAAFFLTGAAALLANVLTAGEGLRLATILAPRVLKDQPLKISGEH